MNEIIDAELRREAYRDRYATGLTRNIIAPSIKELSRKLPRLLAEYDLQTMSRFELSKLTKAIEQEFGGVWSNMWLDITAQMLDLAAFEAEAVAGVYTDFTGSALAAPTAEQIEKAAQNAIMTLTTDVTTTGAWADFVRGNTDRASRQIVGIVREAYANSQTNAQAVQAIRAAVEGITRTRAEALARTGVSHYANVARDSFAEANKKLIEGRYLFATLDNRTTTVCFKRHLNFYPTGERFPPLPFHYGERSQYIFKTKNYDPLNNTRPAVGGREGDDAEEAFNRKNDRLDATRERRAGLRADGKDTPSTASKVKYSGRKDLNIFDVQQIPARTSSDKWLRDQPRWFIEDTLGVERAKLFIDGGLSIDRFADMTGRELTLKELYETAAGDRARRKANK